MYITDSSLRVYIFIYKYIYVHREGGTHVSKHRICCSYTYNKPHVHNSSTSLPILLCSICYVGTVVPQKVIS